MLNAEANNSSKVVENPKIIAALLNLRTVFFKRFDTIFHCDTKRKIVNKDNREKYLSE